MSTNALVVGNPNTVRVDSAAGGIVVGQIAVAAPGLVDVLKNKVDRIADQRDRVACSRDQIADERARIATSAMPKPAFGRP